mmetsp:Transcript_17190/g.32248  ORF Transcript_17190/g.32248 Transcript_17190/m.32248 type:complete len:265 (-) Transcript_17190:20-814(-)
MVQAQSIAVIAVAHAMGNALLLRSTLFPLLEEDSLAMAHLDPSIIIETPFPLEQLCTFVALSLVWNLLIAIACKMIITPKKLQTQTDGHQSGKVHVILMIGISTILIHFVIILCGIHPTMSPFHTIVSAFYLAFNMLLPVLLFVPMNFTSQHQYTHHHDSFMGEVLFKFKGICSYIFGPTLTMEQPTKGHIVQTQRKDQHKIQYVQQYSVLGTISGMGACSILRILDHGMQIQRYPIPIIVGATLGSCGGVLIGAAITTVLSSS